MKLSQALYEIWEFVQSSPVFKEHKDDESIKLFKQLYKEVLEVEKEKHFNEENE